MKTVPYTPSICEGESPLFSGQIVLKVPAYEDRLEVAAMNPEIMELASAKEADTTRNIKALMGILKWSYDFYKKVDLVRISDKKKYSSLDDLRYNKEVSEVLQEVAMQLSAGLDMGKSQG